jgi:molybdate transport system ATP-binding protein
VNQLECHCQLQYASGFKLDVEFTTQANVIAIFGRSGSGKTSLLECIAGLRPPQSGSIRLNEQVLYDGAAKINLPVEARRIGLVFQEHLLFPHLNVAANLRYGERRRQRRAIEFDSVVRVLELGEFLARWPSELSGGQRQRVALGRAILSGPELLLMDEPLTALDDSLKGRILDYLQRAIAEWRIPVLLVTHSQSEVRQLADWVVALDQGRLVSTGSPEEVFGQPELLTLTNSAGPTNLLRLSDVRKSEGHCIARLGENQLWLPPLPPGAAIPQFVECDPGSIVLTHGDDRNLSARNHLPGIVRKIVSLPQGTFVAVDVGQILWALITPEAAQELALVPDCKIVCILKTHSLRLVN